MFAGQTLWRQTATGSPCCAWLCLPGQGSVCRALKSQIGGYAHGCWRWTAGLLWLIATSPLVMWNWVSQTALPVSAQHLSCVHLAAMPIRWYLPPIAMPTLLQPHLLQQQPERSPPSPWRSRCCSLSNSSYGGRAIMIGQWRTTVFSLNGPDKNYGMMLVCAIGLCCLCNWGNKLCSLSSVSPPLLLSSKFFWMLRCHGTLKNVLLRFFRSDRETDFSLSPTFEIYLAPLGRLN